MNRLLSGLLATAALCLGLLAPAHAEGHHDGHAAPGQQGGRRHQARRRRHLVAAIVDAFSTFLSWISGSPGLPQDSLAALQSLDTPGAAIFNARFPAGAPTSACGQGPASANGVRYYSASGTSVLTNLFDLSDPLLGLTSLYFGGESNDGLVSRCSSHWGTVLRDDYPWNHLDEVNQMFGLRGWFTPDLVAFYRTQANRLKIAGM